MGVGFESKLSLLDYTNLRVCALCVLITDISLVVKENNVIETIKQRVHSFAQAFFFFRLHIVEAVFLEILKFCLQPG